MKTPKEKAEELIERFKKYSDYPCSCDADYDMTTLQEKERTENAKQCALICVKEMIEFADQNWHEANWNKDQEYYYNYCQEVKSELEKLK